jgi:hypothetical protein
MLGRMPRAKSNPSGLAEAPPHYHGHRERLRARFREAGADALADYEMLELVLFRAIPQRDVKRRRNFSRRASCASARCSRHGLP